MIALSVSLVDPGPSQSDPIVRIGGWLFKHRTLLPVPFVLAMLLMPPEKGPTALLTALGVTMVAAGESLRLWAVRHIGPVSRTRSDRLGPLIATGPFAFVRNPLYVGNIALWAGFAVSARLTSLIPLVIALLALEYHAIARWEEELLQARIGQAYRDYARQVPRWVPRARRAERADPAARPAAAPAPFSWSDTLYSERGTLVAVAIGFLLLIAKDLLLG
jgi:protein-S-isoprenylcysteine O-methyltransferase Ste14